MGGDKRDTMQRVRIGLTGLALVFLLVLIGAVIRSASHDEPAVLNATEAAVGSEANEQEASDPLAQLGVAPGSAEQQNESDGTGSAPGK